MNEQCPLCATDCDNVRLKVEKRKWVFFIFAWRCMACGWLFATDEQRKLNRRNSKF